MPRGSLRRAAPPTRAAPATEGPPHRQRRGPARRRAPAGARARRGGAGGRAAGGVRGAHLPAQLGLGDRGGPLPRRAEGARRHLTRKASLPQRSVEQGVREQADLLPLCRRARFSPQSLGGAARIRFVAARPGKHQQACLLARRMRRRAGVSRKRQGTPQHGHPGAALRPLGGLAGPL